MAVELRNVLTRSIGRSLPATLLFDYPSLAALTAYLLKALSLDAAEGSESKDASDGRDLDSDVDRLSDDEAEAQLLAELGVEQENPVER